MSESTEPLGQSGSTFDELASDYANNVGFEFTVWDLKILFGEYSDRIKGTDWHTSVTIPWAQAKLMLYYLKLNIDFYEAQEGKIRVPGSMLPPEPPAPSANPDDQKLHEIIQAARNSFLDSLK
jgi:hypothetical protein